MTILTSNFLFAQNKDLLVKEICLKYNDSRAKFDSYDTTMIQIWDESAEGGQAIAYYDNEELKFIEVIWFGETGKRQIEYYFNKGKLIFAYDQYFTYNRPIYSDSDAGYYNGDNEVFDPNKTIVNEDRYYFENDALFLWLDNDKKEVDWTIENNSISVQSLISHCYKMKDELKK